MSTRVFEGHRSCKLQKASGMILRRFAAARVGASRAFSLARARVRAAKWTPARVFDRVWGLVRLLMHYAVKPVFALGETLSRLMAKGELMLAGTPFSRQRVGEFFAPFLRGRVSRLSSLAALGAFTMIILSSNYFAIGVQVIVDGEPVGSIAERDTVMEVVSRVEADTARYLSRPYQLNVDMDYRYAVLDKSQMLDEAELETKLYSKVSEVENLFVLRIDDEIVGATDDLASLQGVLDGILAANTEEGAEASFVSDVEIRAQRIASTYERPVEEISAALTKNVVEEQVYTVEGGDTFSGIAAEHGLSMAELAALNPGMDINKLMIGQTLTVTQAVPALEVQNTKTVTYTEEIPFETITQESDQYYTTDKKTLVEGVNGVRQITAKVVTVSGKEVSREILNSQTVSEPVDKVVRVGTKKPPAKAPTGTMRRPYGGMLTSNYGYRSRGFHTGVDFAGPTGSKVVAADGGTVVFAGWNGGYGRCVIISHGNGLETLYAHNSAITVKVGQKVAKGEQIAKVGNTGNSTGPHCHFEVRVNGKHVNPWKYIK